MDDSTKGSSLIQPIKYKGDAVVQVWLDSRVLATISRWLDEEGNYTRFLSEVVKDSLRMLCDHLVENGSVEMVDDTVEAVKLLERKYRVNLNPNERGKKNKLHNIILSDRRKSLKGRIDSRSQPVTVDDPTNIVYGKKLTEAEARALMYSPEVEKRMEEDRGREMKEGIEKAVEAAKDSGMIKDDVVSVEDKEEVSNTLDDTLSGFALKKMSREELEKRESEIIEGEKEYLGKLNAPLDMKELMKGAVEE